MKNEDKTEDKGTREHKQLAREEHANKRPPSKLMCVCLLLLQEGVVVNEL